MGMYDTFIGPCPHCGREESSQSKLFDCLLDEYRPGDRISGGEDFLALETKDGPCSGCGNPLVLTIYSGTFVGFSKEDPQLTELVGGHTRLPNKKA